MSGLLTTLVEAATGRGGSVRPPPRPRFAPDEGVEPPPEPGVDDGPPSHRAPQDRGSPGRDDLESGARPRPAPAEVDRWRRTARETDGAAPGRTPGPEPSIAPATHPAPATPPDVARAPVEHASRAPRESLVRPPSPPEPWVTAPLLPPLPPELREPPWADAVERPTTVPSRNEAAALPTPLAPPEIRIERIEVTPPAPAAVAQPAPASRGLARAAPRQSLDEYLASRRR